MDMNAEILNKALIMSLEWGENFGKPVQERLRQAYPALSEPEADAYQALCQEIKQYAFPEIEKAYLKQITEAEVLDGIRRKYPLLDNDSLSRLNWQGNYYAWHDNG